MRQARWSVTFAALFCLGYVIYRLRHREPAE